MITAFEAENALFAVYFVGGGTLLELLYSGARQRVFHQLARRHGKDLHRREAITVTQR